MDALETLFTRRSIRKYTDQPVADADVQTMLKAAMLAPSANNKQPWHFIVVKQPEHLKAVAEMHPYGKMAAQAPLAIIVCGEVAERWPRRRLWPSLSAAKSPIPNTGFRTAPPQRKI